MKGLNPKKLRKRQRAPEHEGDFSLSATLGFLQELEGSPKLAAAFRRFSAACDELEQSGLALEDAVMAKLAIDAGLAGCSALDGAGQATAFPWETSQPVPGRSSG